jgi:hypothetical protein
MFDSTRRGFFSLLAAALAACFGHLRTQAAPPPTPPPLPPPLPPSADNQLPAPGTFCLTWGAYPPLPAAGPDAACGTFCLDAGRPTDPGTPPAVPPPGDCGGPPRT